MPDESDFQSQTVPTRFHEAKLTPSWWFGIVPTLHPANFGRVYAAYGVIFIVLSILWGWRVDKIAPDKFDLIGGMIALVGVSVIMYWPRT